VLRKVSLRSQTVLVTSKFGDKSKRFRSSPVDGFACARSTIGAKGWYLWLLTGSSADFTQTQWVGYLLDASPDKAVPFLAKVPYLKVSLVGKDGAVLSSQEILLEFGEQKWLYSQGSISIKTRNVLIAPMSLRVVIGSRVSGIGGELFYTVTETHKLRCKLSEKEVKRLKQIRCSVVLKDKADPKKGH
jgi:hypothetical protein